MCLEHISSLWFTLNKLIYESTWVQYESGVSFLCFLVLLFHLSLSCSNPSLRAKSGLWGSPWVRKFGGKEKWQLILPSCPHCQIPKSCTTGLGAENTSFLPWITVGLSCALFPSPHAAGSELDACPPHTLCTARFNLQMDQAVPFWSLEQKG